MKILPTTFLLLLVTAAICGQSQGLLANRTPLSGPSDVTVGSNGDVYVIESDNCRVRKISAKTRRITTIAGNGKNAYEGDGGLATGAALDYPMAIALDGFGNLYIAEITGRIRKVDANTQVITTIAGNGHLGDGGTGDGGPPLSASFRRPDDLAFDSSGVLFVADDMDHRVRKLDFVTQKISTEAGGDWISMDGGPASGDVLGDGRSARKAALYFPSGIAFDANDNMYIADYQNHRIRRVDKLTGIIRTVAGIGVPQSTGDGGLAVRASVKYPQNVVVDRVGNVFFSDSSGVRRIDSVSGRISRISRQVGDLALDGTSLYISRFNQNHIYKINLRTRRLTVFAGNDLPERHDIIL
jgi:DNA-binding beta-propeller fold protein YncE